MVEKGEISSYSYKTIGGISPFPTILKIRQRGDLIFGYDEGRVGPKDDDRSGRHFLHFFNLVLV